MEVPPGVFPCPTVLPDGNVCGNPLTPNLPFCGMCGEKVEDLLKPPEKKMKPENFICINCKETVHVRFKFCPHCGTGQDISQSVGGASLPPGQPLPWTPAQLMQMQAAMLQQMAAAQYPGTGYPASMGPHTHPLQPAGVAPPDPSQMAGPSGQTFHQPAGAGLYGYTPYPAGPPYGSVGPMGAPFAPLMSQDMPPPATALSSANVSEERPHGSGHAGPFHPAPYVPPYPPGVQEMSTPGIYAAGNYEMTAPRPQVPEKEERQLEDHANLASGMMTSAVFTNSDSKMRSEGFKSDLSFPEAEAFGSGQDDGARSEDGGRGTFTSHRQVSTAEPDKDTTASVTATEVPPTGVSKSAASVTFSQGEQVFGGALNNSPQAYDTRGEMVPTQQLMSAASKPDADSNEESESSEDSDSDSEDESSEDSDSTTEPPDTEPKRVDEGSSEGFLTTSEANMNRDKMDDVKQELHAAEGKASNITDSETFSFRSDEGGGHVSFSAFQKSTEVVAGQGSTGVVTAQETTEAERAQESIALGDELENVESLLNEETEDNISAMQKKMASLKLHWHNMQQLKQATGSEDSLSMQPEFFEKVEKQLQQQMLQLGNSMKEMGRSMKPPSAAGQEPHSQGGASQRAEVEEKGRVHEQEGASQIAEVEEKGSVHKHGGASQRAEVEEKGRVHEHGGASQRAEVEEKGRVHEQGGASQRAEVEEKGRVHEQGDIGELSVTETSQHTPEQDVQNDARLEVEQDMKHAVKETDPPHMKCSFQGAHQEDELPPCAIHEPAPHPSVTIIPIGHMEPASSATTQSPEHLSGPGTEAHVHSSASQAPSDHSSEKSIVVKEVLSEDEAKRLQGRLDNEATPSTAAVTDKAKKGKMGKKKKKKKKKKNSHDESEKSDSDSVQMDGESIPAQITKAMIEEMPQNAKSWSKEKSVERIELDQHDETQLEDPARPHSASENSKTGQDRAKVQLESPSNVRKTPNLENDSQVGNNSANNIETADAKSQEGENKTDHIREGEFILNKKDRPAEDYVPRGPVTRNQSKMKNPQSSDIIVHLHIMVSKGYKSFDPNSDTLLVRFEAEELGGFKTECKWRLHQEGTYEGRYLMKVTLPVPKCLFPYTSSTVSYKYVIWRHKVTVSEKFTWEFIPGVYGYDNRHLKIPKAAQETNSEWHQYDGVMLHKPGKLDTFKSWFTREEGNDVAMEMRQGMMAMLPTWNGLCSTERSTPGIAEEAVKQISQVRATLYPFFYKVMSAVSYKHEIEAKYNQIVQEFMEIRLRTNKRPSGLEETAEQGALRLASALVVIHAIVNHHYSVAKEVTCALCEALLLRHDRKDYEAAVEHFPAMLNDVTDALLKFMHMMVQDRFIEAYWVYAIPLLHFLLRRSAPGAALPLHSQNETAQWWGTQDIETLVARFKRMMYNNIVPVADYLDHLVPLFELDPLLPRTLMAVVGYTKAVANIGSGAQHFPPETFLASLNFDLKTRKHGTIEKSDKSVIKQGLDFVTCRITKEREEGRRRNLQDQTGYIIALCEMALQVLGRLYPMVRSADDYQLVDCALKLVTALILSILHCIKEMEETEKMDAEKKAGLDSSVAFLKTLWAHTSEWMNQRQVLPVHPKDYTWRGYTTMKEGMELKIYSCLLDITFMREDFTTWWQKQIVDFLTARLKKFEPVDRLELHWHEELSNYNPLVEDTFAKVSFEAVDELIQGHGGDLERMLKHTDQSKLYKIRPILSRMLERTWPAEEERDDWAVLTHILTWSPFPKYLEKLYGAAAVVDLLEPDCQVIIQRSLVVLKNNLEALIAGTIEVRKLELMQENKDRVIELQQVVQSGPELLHAKIPDSGKSRISPSEVLIKIFWWRDQEMKAFEDERRKAASLMDFCGLINPVETRHLERLLSDPLTLVHLQALFVPRVYDATSAVDKQPYTPTVIFYQLEQTVKDILLPLAALEKSGLFRELWVRCGRHLQNRKERDTESRMITLEEVALYVWAPANQRFTCLCQGMTNGTITLEELDTYFAMFFNNDEELKAELLVIAGKDDKSWVESRINQIKQYCALNQNQASAEAVLELRQTYGLTGSFEAVELLCNAAHEKKRPLSTITKDVVRAGSVVRRISPEYAECLRQFSRSKDMVMWLSELKGKATEAKTLVNHAMDAVQGHNDVEQVKVQCLQSVVTGYGPLIFDLKKDTNFNGLIALCDMVWRALEADAGLPNKLLEISRFLDWLKEMKKSVGSVETSAMSEAEVINNRGIYLVGCLKDAVPKGIDDVIELKVPIDNLPSAAQGAPAVEAKGTTRTYSLYDLRELQNQLMLVAGKAGDKKNQVDRFVEILDGITRLAHVYLDIGSAGSILFKNWKSLFYCDPDRHVNCTVDFGLSELKLQGRNDQRTTVTQQIVNMCQFMEQCHEVWVKHIEDQRQNYYNLNYFTTQQLVMLRSQLVKLCQNTGQPSREVFPLLHFVKPYCSVMDLQRAVQSALQELQRREQQQEPQDEPMQNELEEEAMPQAEPVTKEVLELAFLLKLREDFPERLCRAALKEVGPTSPEDGQMWCLLHIDDQDWTAGEVATDANHGAGDLDLGAEVMQEDVPLELDAPTLKQMQSKLLSGLGGGNTLKSTLEELWGSYMQTAASTVADYLSVENLGLILEHLAVQQHIAVDRPFMEHMKKDQPNLIVCPQADLYTVVLSLYMNGEGKTLALPQADEVLHCTKDTTAEEVDLIFRRAIGDRKTKIFCLAHADLLDNKIARKAEASLNKLAHQSNDYRLVVICSQDRENSYMVNMLDRHRVAIPLLPNFEELQQYLRSKYTVTEHVGMRGLKPAGLLDPERLSVRLIQSSRAGVGKSLKVKRISQNISNLNLHMGNEKLAVKIPLLRRSVDMQMLSVALKNYFPDPDHPVPRIFHIDLAHEVEEGVDYVLFNLLVLGSVVDNNGILWRRSELDLYLVENMPILDKNPHNEPGRHQQYYVHRVLTLLPMLTCWSPCDSMYLLEGNAEEMKRRHPYWVQNPHDQTMDEEEFHSHRWQRPYQYLNRLDAGKKLEVGVDLTKPEGNLEQMTQCLLKYCGIRDPTWAELTGFVQFLNAQMQDYEKSVFCQNRFVEEESVAWISLPGFGKFVLQFMVQMSRDFATRSLNLSEESPVNRTDEVEDEQPDELMQYIIKRSWESSPHPYLFFNSDGVTMSFLGFQVNPENGDISDPNSGRILQQRAIPRDLYRGMTHNRVDLHENFDQLCREEQIAKLCSVMGLRTEGTEWRQRLQGIDETYVLTSDNVKKILAIYMRFRCDIPVIVMGETGCGKTRLIKFMCDLQKPPGEEGMGVENMVLMKIHGGTTEEEIMKKVQEAADLAATNRHREAELLKLDERPRQPNLNIFTVLFFDEANTTEAIGVIKEIMCDGTVNGRPLPQTQGLKLVAACNPYRKHNEEMIKELEKAGLGYHIHADNTKDRLGRIPMRRLVYRVQPLPQSMLPLVWDFGQLTTEMEKRYIQQMIKRYISRRQIPAVPGLEEVLSEILVASQAFMRGKQHEACSFVSLRDVERVLQVIAWFQRHHGQLFHLLDEKSRNQAAREEGDEDEVEEGPDPLTRAVVLALGVCYQSRLTKRNEYRQHVAPVFRAPLELIRGAKYISDEIIRCQDVFLGEVQLPPNIARNNALRENFFMMVVCIELRIPLFLVGKPGSSKSLAKTIVLNSMEGSTSSSDLFKAFKSVQLVSYQCSQVSTAEGIVNTFRQCARWQKDKDLDKFASVVVLDEVGLAEDSQKMPLKTLHPLLEDGCQGDEKAEEYKKVAFIGISNWALDPAKMNRGIFVQRGVPNAQELEETAKEICAADRTTVSKIHGHFNVAAKSYLEICKLATAQYREYFGLRDYYSLMKMLYGFAARNKRKPTWFEIQHSIKRNFGGLDTLDPVEVFGNKMHDVDKRAQPMDGDPDCTPQGLIRASIRDIEDEDALSGESRYLLILTENYAALNFVQQELPGAIIIFGSSFPKDQEYTQLCRVINLIKVCMEVGRPVVLLKLENLYESLYDALNQYYFTLFGERFVYLGLGTLRVPAKVNKKFRLVVVAEKDTVMKKFPIPLINRMEKQFLAMSNMLTRGQRAIVKKIKRWANDFTAMDNLTGLRRSQQQIPTEGDVFIGYHGDTPASVVIEACQKKFLPDHGDEEWAEQVLDGARELLLQCATPDAVIRLKQTKLRSDEDRLHTTYFNELEHESLQSLLQKEVCQGELQQDVFVQVTTHSRLLARKDMEEIAQKLHVSPERVKMDSLQAFDTEHQFHKFLRDYYGMQTRGDRILVLQCYAGDQNQELINCARYYILNEYNNSKEMIEETGNHAHVVFIIQLPRVAGGCFTGFHGGKWVSYHIDALLPQRELEVSISALRHHTISSLFEASVGDIDLPMPMEQEPALPLRDYNTWKGPELGEGDAHQEDMDVDHMGSDGEEPRQPERMDFDDEEGTSAQPMYHGEPGYPGQAMYRGEAGHPGQAMYRGEAGDVEVMCGRAQEVAPCAADARMHPPMHVEAQHGMGDGAHHIQVNLDVEALIKRCLHQSLSMVKDPEERQHRKTHRVDVLVRLLGQTRVEQHRGQDVTLHLVDVLKHRIAQVLKDKEETAMSPQQITNWQQNAVSFEAINKAGTCRRALRQYLESKVTPILAGLIAYADTNANLEILAECNADEWIAQLWLHMFLQPQITEFKYSDVVSVTQRAEVTEFPVRTTGCDGTNYQAGLPYSWVLKNHIDRLVSQPHILQSSKSNEPRETDETPETRESRLLNVVGRTAVGQVLERVANQGVPVRAMVNLYLQDFVRMVYKPHMSDPPNQERTEHEYKLVQDAIIAAAKESHRRQFPPPVQEACPQFALSMVGIHLAHLQVQHRLEMFSQLVQAWPAVVDQLTKLNEVDYKGPAQVDAEMSLDIYSLHLALTEHLTPTRDQLNQSRSRETWLKKVEHLQPSLEPLMVALEDDYSEEQITPINTQMLKQCKQLWSQVCAVKLFIIHVCPSGIPDTDLAVKKCMPLWGFLRDSADFKKEQSLITVEKFLQISNKAASAHFFGKDMGACGSCKEAMHDPVKLPCNHISCLRCIQLQQQLIGRECPRCNAKYDDNFVVETMQEQSQAIEKHNRYKSRCNAFFMELVSSMCFAGSTPPDHAVLTKLMSYVTRKSQLKRDQGARQVTLTRQMTVFDDCIDPTPVVRSFLLQLMLRIDLATVRDSLAEYFQEARQLMQKPQEIVELCILFVYCLEDHYNSRTVGESDLLEDAYTLLLHSAGNMFNRKLDIDKLIAIGGARHGLLQAARLMHKMYILDERLKGVSPKLIRDLFDAAKNLCTSRKNNKWTGLYLMRQLSRLYGMDTLQRLAGLDMFRWIIPQDVRDAQANAKPDVLAVLGDGYRGLRDAIAKVMVGERQDVLQQALQNTEGSDAMKHRLLLLALFRETTCAHGHPEQQNRPTEQVVTNVEEAIAQIPFCEQGLAQRFSRNQLGANAQQLLIQPGLDNKRMQQLEIVVHWMTINQTMDTSGILHPLALLITNPEQMTEAFLPTMPQDYLMDIRAALVGGTFWQCPNGHPYVIGDCGRPMVQALCLTCGAQIGGENHRATQGNVVARQHDTTAKGHCLGPAHQRNVTVAPSERKLSPAATAITRMLLHMSMFLGLNQNQQVINQMIGPRIEQGQTAQFLWAHIACDMQILSLAVGKSVDDSAMLLHSLMSHMTTVPHQALGTLDAHLRTKQHRDIWEDAFGKTYITTGLQGLDNKLDTCRQALVDDNRFGNNPLLRTLYEIDQEEEWLNTNKMEDAPAMWRFRSHITLDHLEHEFHQHVAEAAGEQVCPVLQLFLREERFLRALQYLPSIIKLQRKLSQRYHRNIDSAEATKLQIKDFYNNFHEDYIKDEFAELIGQYAEAWDLVRADLAGFVIGGVKAVPQEFCQQSITAETPIAMLLPTIRGQGLSALALVHFLIGKQNDFLNEYSRLRKKKLGKRASVQVVTLPRLVAYHPERDLMPIVLANCKYSLAAGSTTAIEYDFASMERQIEDRFIKRRPELSPDVEMVAFREDFTNAAVFRQLKTKIPQELLSQNAQQQIAGEMTDLLELNDCVATVDIAIGFLISVGGDPGMPLVEFLHRTLKMDCRPLVRRAAQCTLGHTQALWMLLSHERVKLLQSYGQQPFDTIDEKYHVPLEAEQEAALDMALQHINVHVFMSKLYECLLLRIAVPQNPNDEDYVENRDHPLGYVLTEYFDTDEDTEKIGIPDERFPASILVKHCISTWRKAFNFNTDGPA